MPRAPRDDGLGRPPAAEGLGTVAHAGEDRVGSSQLLDRADALHRRLIDVVVEGGALEDLCAEISRLVDAAVLITTTDGRVLSLCGDPGDVDAASEFGCFDRAGRFRVEREPLGTRSSRPPAHAAKDVAWQHRMVVGVGAGTRALGRLVAVSRHRALGTDDGQLLERAARIAALVLVKDQEVAMVETKYRAEFLHDLLAGRAGPAEEAIAHAEALGWDIGGPAVVLVAEIDDDELQQGHDVAAVVAVHQRFAAAWMRVVRLRVGQAPCVGFGTREVVALLPAGSTSPDATTRLVRELVSGVRGAGGGGRRSFSTGVSRVVTAVRDLSRAYDDARAAVEIGRMIHGSGALYRFDDLGIFRLLALLPPGQELDRFVTEALGDLAEDSSEEGVDLRRTLGELIDTNLNIAESARRLHFHYNTVRYRIAKLERLVGPFTQDPELRLTLALALKVVAMRGVSPGAPTEGS